MANDRINIGDIVNVYFETVPCEWSVTVLYIPQATGDSWVLRREDGTVIYAQMFSKIERVSRKEEM